MKEGFCFFFHFPFTSTKTQYFKVCPDGRSQTKESFNKNYLDSNLQVVVIGRNSPVPAKCTKVKPLASGITCWPPVHSKPCRGFKSCTFSAPSWSLQNNNQGGMLPLFFCLGQNWITPQRVWRGEWLMQCLSTSCYLWFVVTNGYSSNHIVPDQIWAALLSKIRGEESRK